MYIQGCDFVDKYPEKYSQKYYHNSFNKNIFKPFQQINEGISCQLQINKWMLVYDNIVYRNPFIFHERVVLI